MEQLSTPTGASGERGTSVETTPDIRLRSVRKTYGDVVAVDDIDLEIANGEFFTMLGPSGSGKTTTLRMIAGFELPDSGTVELAGEDVGRLAPYEREVNTVFQDYALFPHMTVGDNVEYGLRVKRVDKGERATRRDEALEMVRLEGYARPQAGGALRRPAPAGGAGALDRQPPAGAAARRAARGARPEAARADAGRAQADPGRGRDHLRLRHPRPGGGADDVGSDRRLQRGQGRAGRDPGRGLRAAREPLRLRLRRRLERGRARRSAVHRPPREDPRCSTTARPPRGCTPSGAGSSTSPTRG